MTIKNGGNMNSVYCAFFDSKDSNDKRQGCCGICSNYIGTDSSGQCKLTKEVLAWSNSIKWRGDNNEHER
jgi:hypothetical protein